MPIAERRGKVTSLKQAGVIKDGVVVLDSPAVFQNGTRVTVEAASKTPVGKRLRKFAGKVADLPEDFARNHDHYLHGQSKK